MLYLTMQYCMDLSPDLRANIDYVFIVPPVLKLLLNNSHDNVVVTVITTTLLPFPISLIYYKTLTSESALSVPNVHYVILEEREDLFILQGKKG